MWALKIDEKGGRVERDPMGTQGSYATEAEAYAALVVDAEEELRKTRALAGRLREELKGVEKDVATAQKRVERARAAAGNLPKLREK